MGPEDWFVNKNTGNVVFVKNESTLTNLKDEKLKKQLGDVSNYERLGDDRMFGTNVKFEGIEGNLIEDYDNIVFNKNSEKFMSSQGYEKSSINLLERSEYEVKDFEGGGFDTNTNITKSSSTKVLSSTVNYRKEGTKDNETILSKKVSNDWTNTLKTTTLRVRTETNYNSKFKGSVSNNSDSNIIKGAAGIFGEFVSKILKTR